MNPLILKGASVLRRFWKYAAAVVAVIVIALLQSRCSEWRWDVERDKLTHTADSLREESRIDSALAALAKQRADSFSQVAADAQNRALMASRDADRLRALRRTIVPVASNPAAPPTVADTLVAVDSALSNCEQETTVLRAALEHNREAVKAGEFALAEVRSALTLETTAAAGLRRSNEDLARKLATADPPCRIAFWDCPSRKTVFIGGAVIGSVVTFAVTRN